MNNKQLPNAKQVREMVDNGISNKAKEEMEYVTKLVLVAINDGQMNVNGNGVLMQNTIKKLKELGYKVENGSQYNESYYNISW